jgi:prophage regulatory protein
MSDPPVTSIDRFLRLPEVKRVVGLSTPTIYRLIKGGQFPKSRKYIGGQAVFWLESEIAAWQRDQLAAT